MLSRSMNAACAFAAALLLSACGAGAQENTAGLAAFRSLSLESVNLTEALYDAILDGNLAGAVAVTLVLSPAKCCLSARNGRCSRHRSAGCPEYWAAHGFLASL